MKKKQLANLIMILVIIVIAVTGILTVGHIQGWFDKADSSQAILTDVRGVVNLKRDGVIFAANGDTVLRSGDELTCKSGATAVIRLGDDYIAIGEKADVTVADPSAEQFSLTVNGGEAFLHIKNEAFLSFDGRTLPVSDAVLSISVRAGAQSINVYSGTVEQVGPGQMITYLSGETSVQELDIQSLNSFLISQIRTANQTTVLCFTVADLDQLQADRNQAIQDILNNMKPSGSESADSSTEAAEADTTAPDNLTPDNSTETDPTEAETMVPDQTGSAPAETDMPTTQAPTIEPSAPAETEPATEPTVTEPKTNAPAVTEPETTAPAVTEPATTAPAETEPDTTEAPETEPDVSDKPYTCTILIRCDTILDNWDALDPAKAEFVPADGIILYPVNVPFAEGDTVFDVLTYVCDRLNIQIEYSYTPLYESYYIEGINHLYEFDCGSLSGWMYRVNGWFPNYGCSSYRLEDGDVIEWLYTCNDLGADVGAPRYD